MDTMTSGNPSELCSLSWRNCSELSATEQFAISRVSLAILIHTAQVHQDHVGFAQAMCHTANTARVLDDLVRAHFLHKGLDGSYTRGSDGRDPIRSRMARADGNVSSVTSASRRAS
jgi:hypothetical protein